MLSLDEMFYRFIVPTTFDMKTNVKNPKTIIEKKPPHTLLTYGSPFILNVGKDVNISNPLIALVILFIIHPIINKLVN